MSEEEMKAIIHNTYEALMNKDFETMLSYCSEDVTLAWASFIFEGKNTVRQWAEGLWQMFSEIKFLEKKLVVDRSAARHDFIIVVTTRAGRKGMLPATAIYVFKNNKIQTLQIAISLGFLYFTKKDLEL